MLNIPGITYSIYALKQDHFCVFSGNIKCGTNTKDADESGFSPNPNPHTHTLRYFSCISYCPTVPEYQVLKSPEWFQDCGCLVGKALDSESLVRELKSPEDNVSFFVLR